MYSRLRLNIIYIYIYINKTLLCIPKAYATASGATANTILSSSYVVVKINNNNDDDDDRMYIYIAFRPKKSKH